MAKEMAPEQAGKAVQAKLEFRKVEAPPPVPSPPALQPYSIVRHTLERQLAPHRSACGRAAAAAEAARAYTWVRALRQPGAEPSRVTNTWPGTCVLSCFSGSGSMLALLCDGIGVRIMNYRALQSRPLDGDNIFGDASWAYPNGVFGARCIAWNPQRESELYMLLYKSVMQCSTQRLRPYEDSGDCVEQFDQVAAEHITFFRSNPQLFAVSSNKGEVAIWDPRASSARPQTTLVAPQNMTKLTQVQASYDGHVITAGARSGQIIMWDVRKSRSGVHQLGAYGPAKQPVLTVISLRKALAAIPGLSSETDVPDSSLQQLLLDPLDDTRAGYTLGCSWQGCIDLQRQEITHAYCPPARRNTHGLRPAMWQPGSLFASLQRDFHDQGDPTMAYSSLEFLDLSSGSASPCSVRGGHVQHSVLPSATCLRLEEVGPSMTAAMHPTTHDIVVPSYFRDELHIVSQLPNLPDSDTRCTA